MSRLIFTVEGDPAPQGSKRYVGNGRMVEMSKKVKPWRAAVVTAAQAALIATDEWDAQTHGHCAVGLQVTFRFARPLSHYGTGRNAQTLKPDAPTYVTSRSKGDADKILRATDDALTTSGVIADDSLIVAVHAFKVYAEVPGADIEVYTVRNVRGASLPPVYRGAAS